jgi:transcriptional regulator with XRE-family HTH domain
MSRRSAKDRAFAKAFGDQLLEVFEKLVKRQKKLSVKAFGDSLNLTRAGLHKAMKGKSVPKLDLIERAQKYDVVVKYGDLTAQAATSRSKKKHDADLQLFLPLAVENLKKDNVRVELGEHKEDTVEVKVWIKFAG